jgi:hypothetical protein
VGYPPRVSGKGKAGPLEAGRGKYSPPANPGRVTSEALKRRDNGVLSRKTESVMKSAGYRNPANKNQETPESRSFKKGEGSPITSLDPFYVIILGIYFLIPQT